MENFINNAKKIALNFLTLVVCAVVLFYVFKLSFVLFKLVALCAAVSVGLLAAAMVAKKMTADAAIFADRVVDSVSDFWKDKF